MIFKIIFKALNNPEFNFDYDGYFDSSVINLKDFKYSVSSFDARFPEKDIFKFGNATGDYTVISDLLNNHGNVYLSDASIAEGTYLHVDDEIIKLTANNGGGNYNCTRAEFGTRRSNHVFNPSYSGGIRCFTGGRWTPIGMEADIYDSENNLVRKVYIEYLRSVGAGVLITFQDILKKLDNNIFIDAVNSKKTIENLVSDYNLFGMADILNMQLSSNIKNSYLKLDDYDENGYFSINLRDVLGSVLAANMSFLIYSNGVYKVRKLLGLSVFNSASITKLKSKVLYGGGWLSSFRLNLSGCLLSFSYISETLNNINEYDKSIVKSSGSTTGGTITGSMADINTEAIIFNIDPYNCLKIAKNISQEYVETFSNVVGELDIDTLRYGPDGAKIFQANKYYSSTELNTDLFTLFTIDTDVIMYCLGVEGNTAKFVLLDVAIHKPVGVAMLMGSNIAGSDTLYFNENENASTFMFTSDTNLVTARHFLYDYLFMGKNMAVFTTEGVFIGEYNISGIGTDNIVLNGYSATDTKEVIVSYAGNSNVEINQSHLHLSVTGEIV